MNQSYNLCVNHYEQFYLSRNDNASLENQQMVQHNYQNHNIYHRVHYLTNVHQLYILLNNHNNDANQYQNDKENKK